MADTVVYRAFLDCMEVFLSGKAVQLPVLSAAQWGQLYTLAKEQSLSGALHHVVAKEPMPDAVADRLRRDAFLTLARYEAQQQAIREIAEAFDRKSIVHLFFKGAVVRRYYREAPMRSMGDIDMVVHEEDMLRAADELCALGFDNIEKTKGVWVYRRADVLVELHNEVTRYRTDLQDNEPYAELWTDAREQHGSTYHLSDVAEAAFAVSHLATHFCCGGCGLRQLMDIAVMATRFPDEATWQGVLDKLKASGTDAFARRLLWLCGRWLAVPLPDGFAVPLDEETERWMMSRMLGEGTFGTDGRTLLSQLRKEKRLQKKGGKLGFAVRFLFPKASIIRSRYLYADRHPVLLPAAYVHRLVDGVTKRGKANRERLQYVKDERAALEKELALYETIGL